MGGGSPVDNISVSRLYSSGSCVWVGGCILSYSFFKNVEVSISCRDAVDPSSLLRVVTTEDVLSGDVWFCWALSCGVSCGVFL